MRICWGLWEIFSKGWTWLAQFIGHLYLFCTFFLESGHEAWSCNSQLRIMRQHEKKTQLLGEKKRKQATLWGPGPPTFLTSWDKYISWVFYCLQPNRIWRDPLLLLTALLRPLEIQLLHSVDNVEPSFEPDEHRNNGVRKIALVLMTNFGTSNVCVSCSVSLWSPGL